MKNNKKLFLSVALLTTLAFSGALVSCDSAVPLIPKDIPTLYKADEVVEGETENTEPIPPSENVEETPSGNEEETPNEEETLQQKIEELEAMLKAQTEELWSKELVSGLTIGGAILFAMELLMTIFKSRANKKKDAEYKDNFIALENKYTELVSCYKKAKVNRFYHIIIYTDSKTPLLRRNIILCIKTPYCFITTVIQERTHSFI